MTHKAQNMRFHRVGISVADLGRSVAFIATCSAWISPLNRSMLAAARYVGGSRQGRGPCSAIDAVRRRLPSDASLSGLFAIGEIGTALLSARSEFLEAH